MISLFAGCFVTTSEKLQENAQTRLQKLLQTTSLKIAAYKAAAKEETLKGQLLCRIFLEYVYAKKFEAITVQDTRKFRTSIHPDQNRGQDTTKIFQLHQGLFEASKISDPHHTQYNALWLYHKLCGWFYHYQIRNELQKEGSLGSA